MCSICDKVRKEREWTPAFGQLVKLVVAYDLAHYDVVWVVAGIDSDGTIWIASHDERVRNMSRQPAVWARRSFDLKPAHP
jgi:hypothetical protein